MLEIYTSSSTVALWTLFILTFLYFLENFDRYLIAVSPIPYIDYSSYEYSVLVGPAFTIIYTVGGLVMALGFYERNTNARRKQYGSTSSVVHQNDIGSSTVHGEGETDGMVPKIEGTKTPPLDNHNEKTQQPTKGIMKFGKYMVITAATFIFSAAFFCTALATTFWQQVLVRVVMGLAQSVITPFSTSIIRDHFLPSVSGAAFGIFNVGTYVAFSLSLSLGIYIYLTFGWKAGYLLFGLIGAGSAFLLPLLYFCHGKSTKTQNNNTEDEGEEIDGGQQSQLLGGEVSSNNTINGPMSPTSSYLSQEAITLSALHHSSRTSSTMTHQNNLQSNSFSANHTQSSMLMGMSMNSSQFVNSQKQAQFNGSFAHSVISDQGQPYTTQQSHPFHNSNHGNLNNSGKPNGYGGQIVSGGSFHSTSFHHDVPTDLLQARQGHRIMQPHNRESFQGSLSTVDVDDDGNNHGGQRHKDSLLSTETDYDEEEYHQVMIRSSLWQRIRFQLVQIVGRYWWKNPGVIVVCVATGIRIGGGYIWSAYTGPFFSDLFQYDSNQDDCSYSYSGVSSISSYDLSSFNLLDGPGSICDSSYPYCVDGTCAALSDNPWHNKGMASINLVTFMSWVPLVGSALGSVLGGFISDVIVNRKASNGNKPDNEENKEQGQSYGVHDQSKYFIDNPNALSRESASRALIAGVSTLISLPIVIFSFYLSFPGCFLIYIASGIVGEVYLSQTLALITDAKVIPTYLVTPAVALFVLIITIIGGNAPLIIPLLKGFVGYSGHVTIDFTAASSYGSGTEGDVSYSVLHKDARNLQYSMMYGLIGCYALSGILYIVAYRMLVRNSKLR